VKWLSSRSTLTTRAYDRRSTFLLEILVKVGGYRSHRSTGCDMKGNASEMGLLVRDGQQKMDSKRSLDR
jgi:hypothetical protein